MKQAALLLLFMPALALRSQSLMTLPEMANARLKLKLNLFDFTVFSQPSVKVQGEYLVKGGEHPLSLGMDLGYIYYSADEDVRARGTYTGIRINTYKTGTMKSVFGVSFAFFRSKTYIDDYLKLTGKLPDMSGDTYFYYEKMKYNKVRYGMSVEALWQFKIAGPLFMEFSSGLGFVQFRTNVPDRVSQHTFINGATTGKLYNGPTVLCAARLGYVIY